MGKAAGNVAQRFGAVALLAGVSAFAGCDRAPPAGHAQAPPTVPGSAVSDPVVALARQHACLNCHAIDRKLVGPAFADIATRYAGSAETQPAVVAVLAQRIREGGSGAWGVVAMPASPALGVEESAALAQWVLKQKSR